MLVEARQRGAPALGRLPAHVKPKVVERLADDSILAYLYPSDPQRRKRGEHLVVRLIEYTLTDPALPGYGDPRSNLRVVKRKMSKWRLKRPEHNHWPHQR